MMKNCCDSTLTGLTVLISGASYGIGRLTALRLAMKGANLILTARTEEALVQLKHSLKKYNVDIEIYVADLYDMQQTDALIGFLSDRNVDIFINNAGKSICRPIVESYDRIGDFTRTMALNYYSPIKIVMSLLGRGRLLHIVNISTMNVLLPPTPYWAAYGASKTAFDYWLKSVAGELAGRLTVGTVYFSLVRTRMIEPTAAYRNVRAMSVDRASEIVARMVSLRKREWKPWWAGVACLFARMFRRVYEKQAMKIIDYGRKL